MKKLTFLLLLTLIVSVVFAQQNPITDTTLKSLIQQAVTNFPRIKELEEQLRINDVREDIIKSNYQPTLSADLSYRYLQPNQQVDLGNTGQKFLFQPNSNYNTALNLNQLIYDFGKNKLALERNNSEQQLTQDNIDNSKNAIAYQVTQIYYSIIFYSKAIKVQEDQIRSLRENERVIQAKVKNGDAIEYDLLTTQVRTANSDVRLKELNGLLEKQYVLLEWLTGQNVHGRISSNDIIDPLYLVVSDSNWLSTNPEARIINRKLELLNYDYQGAKVNIRPSLYGTVFGGIKNGYVPDVTQPRANGGAGLGISIPIISASRPKLQQQLTLVNIETQRKSLNTLRANINKDLATIQKDYETLEGKQTNTEVLVKQAERAYVLAQSRYKEGLITSVEMNLIQNSVEDAEINLIQIRYLMLLDKLESHKTIGTKLYE